MSLVPLIPGAQWTARLRYSSGDAYVPSDYRVLIVLDSPATPTRLILARIAGYLLLAVGLFIGLRNCAGTFRL